MEEITKQQQAIPDPYRDAVENHVPKAGDVYVTSSGSSYDQCCFRLVSSEPGERAVLWRVEVLFGNGENDLEERGVQEERLHSYYRPVLNDYDKVLSMAKMIVDEGKADEVAAMLGISVNEQAATTQSIMATETPEHISALLVASQDIRNKLEEVKRVADVIIEAKKSELARRLKEADKFLGVVRKKVTDLENVISILNLYTGNTVELHMISEGDGAPADEQLSLRQRILFMDEELCVHLDHEADYRDVPAFFKWLEEPVNRDVIVPEPRCIVALKPKRHDMQYRSGDPVYDAARNKWNKHTYFIIRNGENVFWGESDDLEVYGWTFPHEDFETSFEESLRTDRHFLDSRIRDHEAVRLRVIRYMSFLQGLIDQREDIVGKMSVRPNLLKLQGVRLIRDDENLIGTGRKPWRDFKNEKNAIIRRGTRILYVAPPQHYDSWGHRNRLQTDGGDFVHYYSNDWSAPAYPDTGLYSVDEVETVHHHENGKPVYVKHPRLVFKYLPGDKVWDRTEFEERDRRRRVSWEYNPTYVLNYDAVSIEELQGYLEDRTLRASFAEMIPVLVEMKRHKVAEQKDEEAFKALLSDTILRETGKSVPEGMIDEAVAWWKGKVIFTRSLRSDDRKAWGMIKKHITAKL